MNITDREVDQLSYEQAFAELEVTIQGLESDQSTLEEAILLFERGKALAQRCGNLLDKAELRIQILNGEDLTSLNQGAAE
ncbi:MAG: exodeoxyribonuclease VII small subunit [Chloroflexi bacterium]|nr:exodeoxyribonuclease VII small subunit [Anaerolineaceae bacterium]NMB89209.1 exodeoxyribonuclease VII small subunit [Chloroflexota bacterium]